MARLWTVVLLTTAVRAIPAGGRRALLLRGGGDTPNDTFAPYAQLFKQSGASPDAVQDLEQAVAAGASNDECCEKVLTFKREQAMIEQVRWCMVARMHAWWFRSRDAPPS